MFSNSEKNTKPKENNKMQLELKHLAPYVQYGLKMTVVDKSFYGYDVMTLCDKGGLSNISISSVIDEPQDFKPMLRPLYDLTKEIEHNGEKFVPGLKLVDPENTEWDKMVCEEYNAFPKIPDHKKWIQVTHKELGQVISINPYNIEHLPYSIFKVLFEWHFDVFGLIDAGIATERE